MTIEEYTSNQVGIEFSGQLKQKDIENYSGVKPLDLTNYDRVYVKFWRPDGTEIVYTAELRDDTKLMDTDILYKVDTEPILESKRGLAVYRRCRVYRWLRNRVFSKRIVLGGLDDT